MIVEIKSDGTLYGGQHAGTFIRAVDPRNAACRHEIGNVTKVMIDFSWQDNIPPRARIELVGVPVNIVVEGTMFTTIAGRRYRLVETDDAGESMEK